MNESIKVFCAHTDMVPIEKVIPNPKNPNQHDKKQIELLSKIILAQGWRAPITVSNRSGFIVRGHGRLMAAQLLNLQEVPVDYQNYDSEAAEYADLIADNRLAELSEINHDMLGEILASMDGMTEFTGFTQDEIAALVNSAVKADIHEDDFDIETAVDDAKNNTITQLGDIWIMGGHKLMCGSSTSMKDMNDLMLDDVADMIFTDPPYNVSYEGGTNDKLTIMNDSMSDDEFVEFLNSAFTCMHSHVKAGGAIYICHADTSGNAFRNCMLQSGFLLKQVIIWVKNGFVLGRQDYQWAHEPILYGWKAGGPHKFYGGRKQSTVIDEHIPLEVEKSGEEFILHFKTDFEHVIVKTGQFEIVHEGTDALDTVWRFNKPLRNGEHPTMKPIGLCARGIQNSSKKGDIILEPFGGSGSTLIAAEQTGRRCRCMELDPVYCDVIVRRYINEYGEEGVFRIRGGESVAYKDIN